jgi:arsenate reductase (glutaredoxin)
LSKDSEDAVLLQAMAENPILIERPIVFKGAKAVIGRPPEAVNVLLAG